MNLLLRLVFTVQQQIHNHCFSYMLLLQVMLTQLMIEFKHNLITTESQTDGIGQELRNKMNFSTIVIENTCVDQTGFFIFIFLFLSVFIQLYIW